MRVAYSWLFVLIAIAGLAFVLRTPGTKVARQVWNLIGVHQVEAHAELLRVASRESGVDACLLAAVMYVESRGRVDAVSQADALGLFQLMPTSAGDAAKRLGLDPPTREALLSDAELNVRLGANHIAWLIRAEGPDLERVLVAYNAGRTKMLRWIRAHGTYAAWRAKHDEEGSSGALRYAQDVLAFRDSFCERGVVALSSRVEPGAGDAAPGADDVGHGADDADHGADDARRGADDTERRTDDAHRGASDAAAPTLSPATRIEAPESTDLSPADEERAPIEKPAPESSPDSSSNSSRGASRDA